MIVYHGTTHKRAANIRMMGFRPRKPSKRNWFTKDRGYATRRAKQKASRGNDTPVVLTCDLDMTELRRRLGSRAVMAHNHLVVVHGTVTPDVIVSPNDQGYLPHVYSCEHLASWINDILGVKRHKGVSPKHTGVGRMSLWIQNRLRQNPKAKFSPSECSVWPKPGFPSTSKTSASISTASQPFASGRPRWNRSRRKISANP